jgi:hypothetical protein
MKSPFRNLSKKSITNITLLLFVLMITCSIFLKFLDSYFTTDSCVYGIISLELAKELSIVQGMFSSWSFEGRIAASLSTGFDYLYLIIYSFFIAFLIHRLNEDLWRNKPLYKFGVVLIYAVFLAALFDGIENVGLMQLLLGNETQFWTSIAYYFAVIKFIILAISILFLIANFLLLIVTRTNQPSR